MNAIHVSPAPNNYFSLTYNAWLSDAGHAIWNENSGDYDFRIESDNNANQFFLDASTDRIGIGTGTPTATLDVNGQIYSTATTNIGWEVVDGTDNTTCESQCTHGAVFGFNLAAGATAPVIVGPTSALADICLCAGPT